MASASAGHLGRHLGRLFGAGSVVGLTDGELLERFAHRRDEAAAAAFETILARHGAMVLTVCRQVLGDAHAAEDAFQAAFLVLVRRAASLRVREPGSLGPWLHRVAYRIALKARQAAARRRARERRAAMPAVGGPSAALEQGELHALLHEEVNRLPAKYRAPMVLCYFEGRTHDEAAAVLQWPVGTVRGRLARARDLLRARLTRRGLAPSGWVGATLLEPVARLEPTTRLLEATVAAAIKGMPATAVGAMASRMLRSLLLARLEMTAGVLAIALMMAGFGLALCGAPASQTRQPPDPTSAAVATARAPSTPVNRPDDPLPAHARARLGTIRFHTGNSVGRVQYTPDGRFLVTSDANHIIRVWDAASGRIIRDIGDPRIDFRGMVLSPDGKVLAASEYPSRLRLWDVATGQEKRQWHEAKDEDHLYLKFESMAFSPDGQTLAVGVRQYHRATKTYEKWIDLRDTAGPTEHRRRIRADWLWLKDLAFSPDGKALATASQDTELDAKDQRIGPEKGSVRLWDLTTGRERRRFAVEGAFVQSLSISADTRLLAASITDGTVRVYDLATGREREPRPGQEPARPKAAGGERSPFDQPRAMGCLAFSPDGSLLAGGTESVAYRDDFALAEIHLWDVATGRERHRIPAHQQWVASLSFSPDGKTLASTGAEEAIRFWDVAKGREAVEQLGHRSAIRALAVSPADGTVFTGSYDGTIRQWDPTSGRELGIIARFPDPADSWALAPDGKTLIVGGGLGRRLALWSVGECREIRRFPRLNETMPLRRIIWSPDGKTIAAEGRIWDVATGRVLVTFRTRDGQDAAMSGWLPISYSPDGRRVITAGREELHVWDIASGRETGSAIRPRSDKFGGTGVFSPDGRFLARGGYVDRDPARPSDPAIRIWDLTAGREVATLQGHERTTLCLAFSPDGRLLASGSGDRWSAVDPTVRIWDIATGRELRRFEGHRGKVNAVAFTPDGRSVVSGSEDATALVWDISDLTDHPADPGRRAANPVGRAQKRRPIR